MKRTLQRHLTSRRLVVPSTSNHGCPTMQHDPPAFKIPALYNSQLQAIITPELRKFIDLVKCKGHSIRLVGGVVRDLLMDVPIKDVDLASSMLPNDLIVLCSQNNIRYHPTGLQHGTLTVVLADEKPYEVTTLRVDESTDGRWATVKFTQNWQADAQRRDLTINAMSVNEEGYVHDYFDGFKDISNREIRFVGDMEQRITEDYLRILRYYRFYGKINAQHEFALDSIAILQKHAAGLLGISGERIWLEMKQILSFKPQMSLKLLTAMRDHAILKNIHLSTAVPQSDLDKIYMVFHNTSNPVTRLCALCNNQEKFNEIVSHYKLDNHTKAHSNYLFASHRIANATLTQLKQYIMSDKVHRSYEDVVEVVAFYYDCRKPETKIWLSELKMFLENRPKFPLAGADLLEIGYKPGVAVGKMLELLKEKWITLDYKLDKTSLLEIAKRKQ